MKGSSLFCFTLVVLAVASLAEPRRGRGRGQQEPAEAGKSRTGKLFSLFNIVQFQNAACTSQMSSSASAQADSKNPTPGGNRQGVCFSAEECANKGGTSSGSCAAGFGVCCVIMSTGGAVADNCTYLQNPGFPSGYTQTAGIQYTISKCSSDVCSLRLDFETFCTLGPADTIETGGGACRDPLTITATNNGGTFPMICGKNSGQHIYIELGPNAGDTAALNFAFPGAADTSRMWDIKVSQVMCGQNNPPAGCFQYFTATTGTIQTFNFAGTPMNHLANQMYTSCIRQQAGFCCVQYSVCPNVANSFNINGGNTAAIGVGKVDAMCTNDFVLFPGGVSGTCNSKVTATNLANRICGSSFTNVAVVNKPGALNVPLCDCSPPFEVAFRTDNAPDGKVVAGATAPNQRGVCLCYTQLPC